MAISKIDDKNLSDFIVEDMKQYYFPSVKLKKDDEIYLGEVFSNIMYNDQSREATSELVKNTTLMQTSDYANYIASLGYLKSNDFADAEIHIDTAIKMNDQNLNYKKLKAEILAQGKKPQNALKMVDYIKSQKLYSADYTRKVNSLEQFVLYKSKKNYSEKMYHLGYYYYYENELAKSVKTLQGAFSTKKKANKDVYSLLSRVYFDMSDFEKAQDCATKAYKIDSKNTQALLVLGDLSYRTKDYKTALKYYKEAESSDKTSFDSSVKIAQTYEQLGKEKKAFEIYERLLKTYDNCYIAYYKIALKDKSKEIAYLKKALAINITFKDAWIDLGRCAIEQQNYKDAKKYLAVANYIDENDFRYYYYQGLLAKKQGEDGVYYFKKSLSLNPDYQPAKEELKI
jgi:tetratricopeptide (TPR) repeat protein